MFRNSLGKYFVNIHYPGLGTAVGNKGHRGKTQSLTLCSEPSEAANVNEPLEHSRVSGSACAKYLQREQLILSEGAKGEMASEREV